MICASKQITSCKHLIYAKPHTHVINIMLPLSSSQIFNGAGNEQDTIFSNIFSDICMTKLFCVNAYT